MRRNADMNEMVVYQKKSPVLPHTTNYYSSNTLYYKALLQSIAPVLQTPSILLRTTE